MKINENNIFAVLNIGSLTFFALLIIVSLALFSASFTWGVVVGGIVAIANVHLMYGVLKRAMGLPARQAVRFVQLRYALRLAIIAIVLSVLIIYFKVNVFGLLLGLSVLVITLIAVTVYMSTLNGG